MYVIKVYGRKFFLEVGYNTDMHCTFLESEKKWNEAKIYEDKEIMLKDLDWIKSNHPSARPVGCEIELREIA